MLGLTDADVGDTSSTLVFQKTRYIIQAIPQILVFIIEDIKPCQQGTRWHKYGTLLCIVLGCMRSVTAHGTGSMW